jgi:hypothetical protein
MAGYLRYGIPARILVRRIGARHSKDISRHGDEDVKSKAGLSGLGRICMRRIAVFLTMSLAACGASAVAIAQVQELPNVPVVAGGWQGKFWTHPDGTKFHYLEMGTGTPVILIHGSGGTAVNWMMNGLGASLAKTNRVIAIDMRGHGQTVGPDGKRQRRTPNMDLDVLTFMDAMRNNPKK